MKHTYITPTNTVILLNIEEMVAMSVNNDVSTNDGWSNRREQGAWDSENWNSADNMSDEDF